MIVRRFDLPAHRVRLDDRVLGYAIYDLDTPLAPGVETTIGFELAITNPGVVAMSPDEAARAAADAGGLVVVKAQVHSGGRGKAGGVKLAKSPEEARAAAEQILGLDIRGHTVHKVLVAPGVSIAKEFYLGVVLDRPNRKLVVMASAEGGVEIEVVARESPDKI